MTIPVIFDEKGTKPILYWISTQWKGIVAEFFSTMLLLIFGCMSCIPVAGAPDPALFGPIVFGLTVMFNIQIFGHISGAFMNPFVSVIAVIWGKISFSVGVAYVLAECAGAILGYGILMAVSPTDIAAEGICLTLTHINVFQALGVEMALSAALSLLNCGVWDPVNSHNSDSVPLKFGFAIVGLSFAGGRFTDASMNPARSLGPAVWTNRWDNHWVYWVGPMVGGILPALFYKHFYRQAKPKVEDLGPMSSSVAVK